MYVKKNISLWAAVFALVLPLLFTGIASAKYMSDGSVPAQTGGFVTPNDMICIVGVHTDGTLDIADNVTNARDCIYLNKGTMNGGTAFDLTGMTTSAACLAAGGAGNDGARHSFATSICVDGTGKGLSLKDSDRTYSICVAKGGTWKQTSATPPYPGAVGTFPTPGFTGACVAHSRQFKGQDSTGTPLAIGTKGTVAATAGYCYTKLNMTSAGYTATTCPASDANFTPNAGFNSTTAYDWAWTGTQCTYAKGIAGYLSAAITKANNTTYAAGSYLDLSTFTTMGDCLANGGSWNNWVGTAASTTSIPTAPLASTIPAWDYTVKAADADDGCLHCHSNLTQYNGPAERWKDSYLKTGHKNMLRKVVAGNLLTGADGVAYTTDGTNPINMLAGTVNVGGTDHTIRYVWGDWMAVLPTIAYDGGSTYGCGACHTAGFKDNTNPGVQSIGTPGYTPLEPAASGPAYVAAVTAGHKWDLEGITCSRCHNATIAVVTQTQINASSFKTTAPTGGGMGALAAGTGRNNLCFGCHQSIAKNWPAQGGAAGGTTQYNPTLIPTGVNHGSSVGRDFNGHVLGNSFLNSVHARYAGVNNNAANGGITLNALGKYDLFDPNGTTEYNSTFKGYTCWQTPTGNSPAKFKADGTEIKTKADCESLYGVGSWRADATGDLGTKQGTCSTCHDVHNSLFVPEQAEAALRKTCENCHVNNATTGASDATTPQVTMFNHPPGTNTPFDTTKYESSCVVCHMATQAQDNGDQVSMPVHVWRINTDASYNTFPTADQWDGLNGATKDRNAQVAPEYAADGVTVKYANAVWVDLDLACGQCHGGSLGPNATHNVAPYFDKTYLSQVAQGMHQTVPTASFAWQTDTVADYNILFDASTSVCPDGAVCTYAWAFGDGATGSGLTTSHVYAGTATKTVKLTVSANTANTRNSSVSKNVTPVYVAANPTKLTGVGATSTGFAATMNWTTSGGVGPYSVRVNWGDGMTDITTQPTATAGTLTHNYTVAKTYAVSIYVIDSGVNGSNQTSATASTSVTVTAPTVSGKVTQSNGTTAIAGATMKLMLGTVTKKLAVTDASGNYTFTNVAAGSYTVVASKSGVIFPAPAAVTVSAASMIVNISSTTP